MNTLVQILQASWELYYLSAPFILFGLFMAGILQVVLSPSSVVKWMGQPGLSAVARAALLGIPIPLCSCGVFPVSIALRKKGASTPSTMSFLITTPETSADAIVLTWAMLGPVMAIFRPLAAFFTGGLAGALAIAYPPGELKDPTEPDSCGSCSDHGGVGHDLGHSHDLPDSSVGIRGLAASFRSALRKAHLWPRGNSSDSDTSSIVPLGEISRRIGRQAFLHSLDDIVFLLTLGLILAGVIDVLVPPDLITRGLGTGIVPMLLVLLIAIPMYTCASSSTPIAAVLIAKGLSPGAALVLLLAGPAASTASMLLVNRHFGSRFLRIYLTAVIVGALLSGLALDALLNTTGWTVDPIMMSSTEGLTAFAQLLAVIALSGLMIWRLWAGGMRSGIHELKESVNAFREVLRSAPVPQKVLNPQQWIGIGSSILILLYLASGFTAIPPDSIGFANRFGAVNPAPLESGLHWSLPRPFGKIDVWRAHYPRKADIGFSTNLDLIERRKELRQQAPSSEWHSPVSAMNANPEVSTFLTGDENLLELSFSVHYKLSDAYAFFYRLNKDGGVVSLYAEAAAREVVGTEKMESLLTATRLTVEQDIGTLLQSRLDEIGAGVHVVRVLIVDMHPPQPAVTAFRDVSSAREDRQTRIHEAHQIAARDIPLAHGAAAVNLAQEGAAVESKLARAKGESLAYLSRVAAYQRHPKILRHLLWLESSERALANKRKYILPPGRGDGRITFWDIPVPTVLPPQQVTTPASPKSEGSGRNRNQSLDPNGDL